MDGKGNGEEDGRIVTPPGEMRRWQERRKRDRGSGRMVGGP